MYFRPGNVDSVLNQLHRTMQNAQVNKRMAQHMQNVDTGENPPKGADVRSGEGSSSGAGGQLGTLKGS